MDKQALIQEAATNINTQRRNSPDSPKAQQAVERNREIFPQLEALGVTPDEVLAVANGAQA